MKNWLTEGCVIPASHGSQNVKKKELKGETSAVFILSLFLSITQQPHTAHGKQPCS